MWALIQVLRNEFGEVIERRVIDLYARLDRAQQERDLFKLADFDTYENCRDYEVQEI